MQHLPSDSRVWEDSGCRACVSKQWVRQRLHRKDGHLSHFFFLCQVGRYRIFMMLGVNSLIPSKQGTEVDWGSCVMKLFLFLASPLHSFTGFLSPKYPEAHEERVMIILHFLGVSAPFTHFLAFSCSSFLLPPPTCEGVFFFPYHQVKNGRRLWKLCV